jgi:hypothetical protein
VDEAIRIDADGNPLDDVERLRMPPIAFLVINPPLGRFG